MTESHARPAVEDLLPAWKDAATAKYEQLRDDLIAQIENGQLKAGDSLPSETRLAESLGIARSTVRQALAELERSGIVLRVHGKGTFVHEQARQRLKKGQDLFALIVPETAAGFYPSLQISFEGAAAARHNQVIVCNSGNDVDKQGNSILQLMDLRVAGVAIVPTTSPITPAFQIRQLKSQGIPVVCCSRPVEGVQTPLLAIPFEEVGRRAGALLREAGHRSVAFLSGFRSAAGEAYEVGFRKAIGSQVQVNVYYGSNSAPDILEQEEEMAAKLLQLFDSPNPPTGIFATFDSLAELTYVLLSRMGLRVPEDVSLVSFGGTRRQGALVNRLTSITVDEVQMGTFAIEMLEQMRTGKLAMDANEIRVMPLGLSEGRTLGPQRSQSKVPV